MLAWRYKVKGKDTRLERLKEDYSFKYGILNKTGRIKKIGS